MSYTYVLDDQFEYEDPLQQWKHGGTVYPSSLSPAPPRVRHAPPFPTPQLVGGPVRPCVDLKFVSGGAWPRFYGGVPKWYRTFWLNLAQVLAMTRGYTYWLSSPKVKVKMGKNGVNCVFDKEQLLSEFVSNLPHIFPTMRGWIVNTV